MNARRLWVLVFAATLALGALSAVAAAGTIAYQVPAGTVGNQTYGGPLGMDFNVNGPVIVTHLGVFDSDSNGLSRPLSAYLWNRTSTATPLVTAGFTGAVPGTLVGGSRFKPLATPILLSAGFQGTVSADGYGAGEPNGNSGSPVWTTDTGGGLLSFVGTSRYGTTPGTYPGTADGGPANRYAAGTFAFVTPAMTGGTGPGGFLATGPATALTLWLKGDAGITKDALNRVSAWADQSGRGVTMLQADTDKQPLQNTTLNGRALVTFDGGGAAVPDEMISSAAVSAQTVFLANVSLSAGLECCNPVIGNQTSYVSIRRDLGVTNVWRNPGDTNDFTNPAGSVMRIDGAPGNATTVGTPQVLSAVRGTGAFNFTNLKLAQHTGYPVRAWNGSLGEVVMFNRALNAVETALVDNYLSAKFGVPLNTAGGALDLYTGDDPGKGNYDLDVFGIGRVSAAAEVSSAGSAGLGIQAGFLGDGQWLLAGHKTPVNSLVAEPSVSMVRWDRVWYLDATAQPDAVLTFDFSDAGLGTQGMNGGYELLYSPTNAFAFQRLPLVPMLYDDRAVFVVPSSMLLDGYYTLGIVPEPSSAALAGAGMAVLLGLAWRVRRRR